MKKNWPVRVITRPDIWFSAILLIGMAIFFYEGRGYSPTVGRFSQSNLAIGMGLVVADMVRTVLRARADFLAGVDRSVLPTTTSEGNPVSRKHQLLTIGSLIVFVLLVYLIGFMAASFVYVVLLSLLLGFRNLIVAVACAVGIVLLEWGLMSFIGVPLPHGLLFGG